LVFVYERYYKRFHIKEYVIGGTCSVYWIMRDAWIILAGNFGIKVAYMKRVRGMA
jgi:hypothetical protein